MKVTLDTNVLVSGTFWTGDSFHIMVLVDTNKITNITSKWILNEYYETINSDEIIDKISEKSLRMMKIIDKVIKKSKIVETSIRLNIVKDDPDDNRILECAKAGNVDYIISNDKHILKLKQFRHIPILTPKEFIKNLKK